MRGTAVQIEINYNKTHFILLSVLDNVLSALVVAPAVIGYWRGTWNLADVYLFPQNEHISMLSSLIFGILGHIIFTHLQDYLTRKVVPEGNRLGFYLMTRAYTYVFGAVCIHLWRGIWKALEYYCQQEVVKVLMSTSVSIGFLAVSRGLRNLLASPFIVVLDIPEGYFAVPTMFKIMGSKVGALFILDSLYGILVVGSLVVFAWRGVWCLFDIYLYPVDKEFSSAVSLVIGYGILFVVMSAQGVMKKWCENLTGFWRLVLLGVYLLTAFVGTINVWRGIWNFFEFYFLPDSPVMSYSITHFGCFALLVVINCSNSVLVRGVLVDGEEEGGQCAALPTFYLRTLLNVSECNREEKDRGETSKSKKDVPQLGNSVSGSQGAC